jgi:MFS family permease
MLITQAGSTLSTLALAVLTFRGLSTVWPIYVLAALGAAVGAFDLPARQALVPTLVPREHLPNAITLNTIMFQIAAVVGPSLGGILIAAAGVGWVYVVNALSLIRDRRAADDGRRAGAPLDRLGARRGIAPCCARRSPIRLPLAAHPVHDAAGFLRDLLLVGDGSSADFRAGHSEGRREGIRLAVRRAGSRRAGDERRDGAAHERIERRGPTLLWAITGYGLATVVFGLAVVLADVCCVSRSPVRPTP